MPPSIQPHRRPDIAVIGGGIVGLWTAYYAARQGRSVTLIEKRTIGAGASGGLLGALMPHQPTGWNAKKQFQLDGLVTLETEIAALEETTGVATGYRRCGRLMPIGHAKKRRQSDDWAAASTQHWPEAHRWRVTDDTPDADWLPPTAMPHGANHDTLSARVSPRRLIEALRAAATAQGAEIREGTGAEQISPHGDLILDGGETLPAGRTVLAAGWEGFALLQPFFAEETGRGVKGQAALLRPARPVDPGLPILYDSGVYAIAHDDGSVAVGSTSENAFDSAGETDGKLDEIIVRAQALCPALEGAGIVERWAGVRPRAAGREPLVGPVPGAPNVIAATGGFKISLAIAHLMAKAAIAHADGEKPDVLPDAFMPENRFTPRRG